MNKSNELNLLVSEKRGSRRAFSSFASLPLTDQELAPFSPGSHIAVMTPSGANRQYSLINDGHHPEFYQIAVKLETESRGGSQSMHTDLGIGDPVTVQAPENSFPLVEAPEYLFIGGGIGITPLVGMTYFL